MRGLLLSVFFCLTLTSGWSPSNASEISEVPLSEKICANLLGDQSTGPSHSFYKLAEESLKAGIVSLKELQNSILAISPRNPIASIGSTEAQIFSEGFDTLLREPTSLQWPWIQEKLQVLLAKKELVIDEENVQIEKTKFRFAPYVSRQIALPSKEMSTKATFFIAKDGRELAAFSTRDGWAYILDLNSPTSIIKIFIRNSGYSDPVYFVSKDGRERVAFGTQGGTVYLVDLNDPSRKESTYSGGSNIQSNLVYFSAIDGREFIAFGSDSHCFFLVDLDKLSSHICIPTSGIVRNSVLHHRTKDNRDLVVAGSADGHLYLADVLDPRNPKKISIDGEATSSPLIINTKSGNEIAIIGSADRKLHFIDLIQGQSLNKIPVNGTAKGAPSYFVKSDGQEILSAAMLGGAFTIIRLSDEQILHKASFEKGVESDLVSFKVDETKEIVALVIPTEGVHFTNLNNPRETFEVDLPYAESIEVITRKDGKKQILVSTSDINTLYLIDFYQENLSKAL